MMAQKSDEVRIDDLEETISDNYVSEMSRFLTEFNTSESRNLEKKITKKEH